MHFTRDPIIETIITPREGCKLAVRSTKGARQEEYLVDAIEVVSFGHSFFYRSPERPKSFLVPVSDFEVVETKEMKLSLKNTTSERSIKIGGGKESSRSTQEEPSSGEKKAKEKRRRSKKTKGKEKETKETPNEDSEIPDTIDEINPVESKERAQGENKASSFISKLFPPPSTLIQETINKYKLKEEVSSEDLFQIEEGENSSESEQDLGKIDKNPPDIVLPDNPEEEE